MYEHAKEHRPQWAAIESIASKIGCAAQTLSSWIKRREVDTGQRAAVTTDEHARVKVLEREVKELRRANEILRSASHTSRHGALNVRVRTMAVSVGVEICRPLGAALMGRSCRRTTGWGGDCG